MSKEKYQWDYCSLGGTVRVNIKSGEDISHLGELEQEKWTVLSCPASGLQFNQKTLTLLDSDGDGKIRVPEVVAAAQWITSVIKDKDLILKGDSVLPLAQINTDNEDGRKLLGSAKQILSNLKLDKDSISIEESSNSVAIFADTKFNGDGVITPASAEGDIAAVITDIVATMGGVTDRSGVAGVNADKVEAFYAAAADYSAWQAEAEEGKAEIFPFGDSTEAALSACEAVKDKVADYFMRCKLINFNEAATAALDVSVDKIGAISGNNLATCGEEIATYPLARPVKGAELPFDAINPAWQGAFDTLKTLVFGSELAGKESMTEAEWQAILGKFGAYTAWKGAKKGAEVEVLGLDRVNAILKADDKAAILALIAKDAELKEESESIDAVDKLMHYYRYFGQFLNNYVLFSDFYAVDPAIKATFEAGKLYIDQRCCKLCIQVTNMGAHADMAGLSGMFLIYCVCTSKTLGKTMDIVAVMTDGDISDLRPGKNAIFYDRDGNDWDAVVTKVVDNPISVKQAFWSPYRKLAKFISDKIDKSAAEKDSAATANLLSSAENATPGQPKQPFDIGKFAGIFAAIGMAVGALGAGLGMIISGLKGLPWWQYLVIVAAIMLIISGPACFIAWRKLRKRNLGPVLNANGWAINSKVLVNIIFGATLTSIAKYPKGKKFNDPYKKVTPTWRKVLYWFLGIVVVAGAALYFTDNLKCIGLPFHKDEPVEEVVEGAEAADADAAEAGAETAAEAPADAPAEPAA